MLRVSQRLIVFLLTDVLRTQQLLITLHRQFSDIRGGLRFCQIALSAVVSRLVSRRINLIERDSRFDITSLNEITLQDNAAYLRANFGDTVSNGTTRKFSCDLQWFRF
ncbi:Uncharacterised protein [Salmonella enterica subsp. enterica serovar Bovismorbificans]|nr:Uncharacterised protein [Salmonella enterica subsp. enterica serovar Bovismorbificans]CRJ31690.1 Uncharacterised protein [Salmonella enterica subsp. enterica serovar Typhi]